MNGGCTSGGQANEEDDLNLTLRWPWVLFVVQELEIDIKKSINSQSVLWVGFIGEDESINSGDYCLLGVVNMTTGTSVIDWTKQRQKDRWHVVRPGMVLCNNRLREEGRGICVKAQPNHSPLRNVLYMKNLHLDLVWVDEITSKCKMR